MGKFVDGAGEPIYFKEPYFDQSARRVFKSKEEKYHFMKANNIVQNGDSDEKVKRERKEYLERQRDERRR